MTCAALGCYRLAAGLPPLSIVLIFTVLGGYICLHLSCGPPLLTSLDWMYLSLLDLLILGPAEAVLSLTLPL